MLHRLREKFYKNLRAINNIFYSNFLAFILTLSFWNGYKGNLQLESFPMIPFLEPLNIPTKFASSENLFTLHRARFIYIPRCYRWETETYTTSVVSLVKSNFFNWHLREKKKIVLWGVAVRISFFFWFLPIKKFLLD